MYNHQTEDTVKVVREFMHQFQKRHDIGLPATGMYYDLDANQTPSHLHA